MTYLLNGWLSFVEVSWKLFFVRSDLYLHHGLTSVPVCGTILEEFLGHVQQVQQVQFGMFRSQQCEVVQRQAQALGSTLISESC